MIGAQVRIGPETVVGPYAVIEGCTVIGARNQIFQFASLGAAPQDLKYHGEPSRLEIGDDNKIREFATIHRGTEGGGMVTRIGNAVLVMNYVHVAHDCIIGDHCIIANSTELAGHCVLEEWVVAAGLCGIHQFTRIGEHAMLAAGSEGRSGRAALRYGARATGHGWSASTPSVLSGGNSMPKPRRRSSAPSASLFYSKFLRDEAIAQVLRA